MGEALTTVKTGLGLLKLFESLADPDRRRALDSAITEHVLQSS